MASGGTKEAMMTRNVKKRGNKKILCFHYSNLIKKPIELWLLSLLASVENTFLEMENSDPESSKKKNLWRSPRIH